MLANRQIEAVDDDGAWDLYCAMAKLAREDYLRGQESQHYDSAYRFLEQAGLLARVTEHYGIEHPAPAQLQIDFEG